MHTVKTCASTLQTKITMITKYITPVTLAQIVSTLLTTPALVGELEERTTFDGFFADIGQVVSMWCGGVSKLIRPDDASSYINVESDDSLPEGGGIWENYAIPNNFIQKYSSAPRGEHPIFTSSAWINCVREEETILGYWEWVIQQQSGLEKQERCIFTELWNSKEFSLNNGELKPTQSNLRRDLVANFWLLEKDPDTIITSEVYDSDPLLQEILTALIPDFEFPNWVGKTFKNVTSTYEFRDYDDVEDHIVLWEPLKHGVGISIGKLKDFSKAKPLESDSWEFANGNKVTFKN